jgi:hypothetical protein
MKPARFRTNPWTWISRKQLSISSSIPEPGTGLSGEFIKLMELKKLK